MTGLFLLFVIISWVVIAKKIAKLVVSKVSHPLMKRVMGFALLPLLIIAPLADEIIAIPKMYSLCKQNSSVIVNEKIANNAEVIFIDPVPIYYNIGAVRIRIYPFTYVDKESKEVVVSYNMVSAKGGFLIKSLGISGNDSPLIFDNGCGKIEGKDFEDKYNIKVLNKR